MVAVSESRYTNAYVEQEPVQQINVIQERHAKVALPVGKIGVIFSGTPPRIQNVAAVTQPAATLLKPGQVVLTVGIPGEIEASGLTTTELVHLLRRYEHVPRRFLIVAEERTTVSVVPTS